MVVVVMVVVEVEWWRWWEGRKGGGGELDWGGVRKERQEGGRFCHDGALFQNSRLDPAGSPFQCWLKLLNGPLILLISPSVVRYEVIVRQMKSWQPNSLCIIWLALPLSSYSMLRCSYQSFFFSKAFFHALLPSYSQWWHAWLSGIILVFLEKNARYAVGS